MNNVLFTDIGCFVISPDFKLTDESQVLLKVPRRNNMYSVDMKNSFPKESLTCHVVKATFDESMLWHRWLGHITKLVLLALRESNINPPNKGLVVKPHNKTLYELFRGRTHALSFMRPFGCHITILNTLDYLGKFDGKAYKGPEWLFDIDMLTKSLNYVLVIAGTNSDDFTDGSPLFDSSLKISGDAGKKHDEVSDKESRALNKLNSAFENLNTEYPNDPKMPSLETIETYDDSKEEADFTNLKSLIHASPTPTIRTHKNHPLKQVIGSLNPLVQTRSKLKPTNEQGFIKPTRVAKALSDPTWVEEIQEELLHFKLQKVWILVDFPKGKNAIGTKCIFRNKKGKRGIVIKNKARLVAQGYTQEKGIDYDEVFAPVARIKVIRLFLAYASFMGFMVYQMDAKSAFIYGRIEEEVNLLDTKKTLVKDTDGADEDVHLYTSMIGSLMYLTASRLDIMYVGYGKKQTVVATSTTEAEYMAAASCCGQIQALVDKKKVIITETSVRSDLHLEDAEGKDLEIPTDTHHTPTITQPSTSSQPKQKHKSKKSKKKITEVPRLSDSTHDVADEHVTTTSNDPLLSGEDRLKLIELMELCTKLKSRVVALETTKANQALEIGSLKRRVKKLDKKARKKTHKLKRLYKIDVFDTRILDGEEVVAEKEVNTADPVPTTGVEVTTVGVETSKPKAKEILIQEPSKTPTPTPIDSSQPPSKVKDKGKAKIINPKNPLKKKDQSMIDEEVSRNLKAQMQAELEKEERLARQKEEEANIALIESWDKTQAMMDVDYELAVKLKEEERGDVTIEEKSRLFVELIDKRKKYLQDLELKKSKWIKSFVLMDTELVKGGEKVAEGSEKAAEGSEKAAEGSFKRA
uniref:Retrovirus-related Pol polyprotein from transposon TNT 1-94 n=1 Tax=Tanacetum cinerariifolium TaxID=118510 RepID=A0A6L2KG81_TANCI|nr:retrovirus-related Pol polyprotein from transposon TNT 1-94 [Tanacetum cinerariifolium]